jgi:hypothetical protein
LTVVGVKILAAVFVEAAGHVERVVETTARVGELADQRRL